MDVVDKDDKVLYQLERTEILKQHLWHRGVATMIFNDKDELYIHQRSKKRSRNPGMYDIKCGGGVATGEDFEEATKRELEEETGIKNTEVTFLFKWPFVSKEENYIGRLYVCRANKVKMNTEKIEQGMFVLIDQIPELRKKYQFCPDAIVLLDKHIDFKKIQQQTL